MPSLGSKEWPSVEMRTRDEWLMKRKGLTLSDGGERVGSDGWLLSMAEKQ